MHLALIVEAADNMKETFSTESSTKNYEFNRDIMKQAEDLDGLINFSLASKSYSFDNLSVKLSPVQRSGCKGIMVSDSFKEQQVPLICTSELTQFSSRPGNEQTAELQIDLCKQAECKGSQQIEQFLATKVFTVVAISNYIEAGETIKRVETVLGQVTLNSSKSVSIKGSVAENMIYKQDSPVQFGGPEKQESFLSIGDMSVS